VQGGSLVGRHSFEDCGVGQRLSELQTVTGTQHAEIDQGPYRVVGLARCEADERGHQVPAGVLVEHGRGACGGEDGRRPGQPSGQPSADSVRNHVVRRRIFPDPFVAAPDESPQQLPEEKRVAAGPRPDRRRQRGRGGTETVLGQGVDRGAVEVTQVKPGAARPGGGHLIEQAGVRRGDAEQPGS
jgi:hypothetical protein